MFNKSTQAQALIPMAVSLGFGIMFATLITLIMIPVMYITGRQLKYLFLELFNRLALFYHGSN